METCKATIQEGPRKGKQCQFPPDVNLYCGRHVRNKIYDDGIAEGKSWCRFFFRGCNNEVQPNISSCEECRKKLCKKQNSCKHEGCRFKVSEGNFCKKHERDKYFIEEKEKGIKYCDILRGCFSIVTDKKTCDSCLEQHRVKDNERYTKRKTLIKAEESVNALMRSCIKCTKEFEAFKTRYGNDSMNCSECAEKQATNDKKRSDRERNFKEERLQNLEAAYKYHITGAIKRGYGDFQLDFIEFQNLVTSPCHYCKSVNEKEAIGIDRVNNDIGYTKENCVPACWMCNRMKHFYHPEFFIEKCKIIAKVTIPTMEFYSKWALYYTRSNNRNYTTYKREAEETRKLPFEITQEQWDWLTRSPCYLCGYQDAHGIGIDRVDNTIRKYSLENCRPCCGSCNSMKNDIPLDEFIKQSTRISSCPIIFNTIPVSKNPLKEAENKGHLMNPTDRIHWKSKGLYYAILSDSASSFLELYSDVYSSGEFKELSKQIKESEKNTALDTLKTLLSTLKKRKYRKRQEIHGINPTTIQLPNDLINTATTASP